jgi:hypothetical protein
MEEVLFSRCKYEIRSAIHALQDAVLKLRHIRWPRYPLDTAGETAANRPLTTRRRLVRLFHFPARLLPVSFAGKRLLCPELLTWFEVERVTLHFFDDVLLLDLSLKPAKGVLESFTLLKLYFSQTKYTSKLDQITVRCGNFTDDQT